MPNQFEITWLLRHCASTYARFIAEDSNALKTVYSFWFLRQDRLASRIVNLCEIHNGPRPFGTAGKRPYAPDKSYYLLLEQHARTLTLKEGPLSG